MVQMEKTLADGPLHHNVDHNGVSSTGRRSPRFKETCPAAEMLVAVMMMNGV